MAAKGGKQESAIKIDPAVQGLQLDNYSRAQALADQPVTPYSGSLDLSASQGAARGLLDFQAPQITAASLDRGNVRDVSGGTVGAEQIRGFLNPYTDEVVNNTLQDTERARQIAISGGQGAATGAGAFGGSRHGVSDSLTNGEFARAGASAAGNLRMQGFNTALSAAQTEAARTLQAAMANQGVDLSVEQANAMLEQQTRQANQGAAISSAGVRAQGAGLLGNLQQTEYDTAYQEWLRQQNDPMLKQGLLTQALGGVQAGQTTTATTTPGLFDYAKLAAQVGGTAAMAFSDGRLKEDVKTVGHDAQGRRIVDFRYVWDEPGIERRGYIAQEIAVSDPHAVHRHASGFLMVDYGAL